MTDEQKIEAALVAFPKLNAAQAGECDAFFGTYGRGIRMGMVIQPWECFAHNEQLLKRLEDADASRYRIMHKGTPFYILAAAAWDMHNYDQALFHLDAAISEDYRKDPGAGLENPAAKLLLLDDTIGHVAGRVHTDASGIVKQDLNRFNGLASTRVEYESFKEHFLQVLLSNPNNRTILTSLYVFLMERSERVSELKLRSSGGGTIALPLLSMLKGALILETLLKLHYFQPDGAPFKQLGNILQSPAFKADFGIVGSISADSIEDILTTAGSNPHSVETAFQTAGQIRNTTAHKITWDDKFNVVSNFSILHEHIADAIFYLVDKKYTQGRVVASLPASRSGLNFASIQNASKEVDLGEKIETHSLA